MRYFLLTFLTIVSVTSVIAQNEHARRENLILTDDGKIIENIKIVIGNKYTNEDQVTYLDASKVRKVLKANEISGYFDGKVRFSSVYIENERCYKFINFEVTGYLNYGRSYGSKGRKINYYKKNDAILNLDGNRKDLEGALRNYISDYDQFQSKYLKKTIFSYKSLAEYASAYNTYKFPDKYVFVRYSNEMTFGLKGFLAYNNLIPRVEDIPTYNLSGYSINAGAILTMSYSRFFDLNLAPSYFNTSITSLNYDLNIKSVNFEVILMFILYEKNFKKLTFGPGVDFSGNIKSELIFTEKYLHTQSSTLKKTNGMDTFNGGFSMNAYYQMNKKITFSLAYKKMYYESVSVSVINDRKKIQFSGISLGVLLTLN